MLGLLSAASSVLGGGGGLGSALGGGQEGPSSATSTSTSTFTSGQMTKGVEAWLIAVVVLAGVLLLGGKSHG